MKKSVLIVASDMEIGGAERALLGLLDAFNTNNYQVDLFLMRHTGSFLTLIPSKINIIPENKKFSCLAVPIQQVIKKKCFGVAFGRLIGKIKAKLHLRKNHVTVQNSVESLYSFKYTMRFLPMISDKYYDLAIGFTTPYYVVEKKSLAKTKIVWIHTDYTKEYSDTINEERVWSVYDKIVGVSDAVCESFASKYPGIKDKIIEMDNIVSVPIIWNQANDFSAVEEMPEDGSVRLLSIGRFCYAKNFDSIPFICRYLLEKGIGVKWYLIGFGSDEQLIRDNISKANVESNVIILGKRDNPYPYIKACDIYVQP